MNDIKALAKWSKNEQGVTMIEVLMAIAIIAVGILAVVAMQTSSARGNSTSSGSTDALILAVNQMEQLMELDWGNANLADSGGVYYGPFTSGQYSYKYKVDQGDVFNDTKTITMTVTWSSWGANRTISIQQVIPRII